MSPPVDIDFERGSVYVQHRSVSTDYFSKKYYCESQFRGVVKQFEALKPYPDGLKAFMEARYLMTMDAVSVRRGVLSLHAKLSF
jgi:hypothetical protein